MSQQSNEILDLRCLARRTERLHTNTESGGKHTDDNYK